MKWFFVIARNSSFTYKGRAVDVKQVGRELGVRYVLEGSIRKAGERLRITGQLIEASTGHQSGRIGSRGIWKTYSTFRTTITDAIVAAIEPSMSRLRFRGRGRKARRVWKPMTFTFRLCPTSTG